MANVPIKTVPARDYGYTEVIRFQEGTGPFPDMSRPGRELMDKRIEPFPFNFDYNDPSDEPDRMYMLPQDMRRSSITMHWLPTQFIPVTSQDSMYPLPSYYSGDLTDILEERFI